MSDIFIKANLISPAAEIGKPSVADGFFYTAEEFHRGFVALKDSSPVTYTFLFGFCLELYLKAYLSYVNPLEFNYKKLKRMLHNIDDLWNHAIENKINLAYSYPDSKAEASKKENLWLFEAVRLHKENIFRYPFYTENVNGHVEYFAYNGTSCPPWNEMFSLLKALNDECQNVKK